MINSGAFPDLSHGRAYPLQIGVEAANASGTERVRNLGMVDGPQHVRAENDTRQLYEGRHFLRAHHFLAPSRQPANCGFHFFTLKDIFIKT